VKETHVTYIDRFGEDIKKKEMKRKYYVIISIILAQVLFSCAHYKDIPYFQNSAEYDGTGKGYLYEMKIKPKDELTVFVFSSMGEEAVSQFNLLDISVIDIRDRRIRGGSPIHRYLVDNDGNIDFPVVGKVHVAGFTITQANEHIRQQIKPYLQADADCIVNVNIENYEIAVMGEVKVPNSFSVTRNRITVLEALAMAGDMTIYGKRDNVKILRELSDGTYEVHKLDLRDANIVDSPYYYLEQRDIVYVEPNEAMAQNAKIGQTTKLWLRGVSITISLGSLLYRVLN
jgi:polysaccharide export outer membrane protein